MGERAKTGLAKTGAGQREQIVTSQRSSGNKLELRSAEDCGGKRAEICRYECKNFVKRVRSSAWKFVWRGSDKNEKHPNSGHNGHNCDPGFWDSIHDVPWLLA